MSGSAPLVTLDTLSWFDGSLSGTGPLVLDINAVAELGGLTTKTSTKPMVVEGILDILEGTLDQNGGFTLASTGFVQGDGILDLADATLGGWFGDMSPGTSPGRLGIVAPSNGLALDAISATFIDLEGIDPGTGFDVLDFTGNVTFDGELVVDTVGGGFAPALGDTFPVITVAGTRTGDFSNVTVPTFQDVTLEATWSSGLSADTLYLIALSTPTPMLFTSSETGNNEIWRRSADGQTLTQLTNTGQGTSNWDAEWSPDGTQIVFSTFRNAENDHVWIMEADGSLQTELTSDGVQNVYPSWSPDGSRIVFAKDTASLRDVWIMNKDGTGQTQLTNSGSQDSQPHWSPDGSRIVFFSNRTGTWQIFTMGTDGSNQVNLSNNGAFEFMPQWSPDGSRIVFVSNQDGNDEIYVMDADGSNRRRLTANAGSDLQPSWSPDGTEIVFSSDRTGDQQIYIMNADGSNVRLLESGTVTDQFPDLRPN